jgi:parallel beta-helix repeat protein
VDAGSGNIFDGNNASGNAGYGFRITANSTLFKNNFAGWNTVGIEFDPLSTGGIFNQTLINNTATNNLGNIRLRGPNSTLVNNTAANASGSDSSGFEFWDNTNNLQLINNTAYNNTYAGFRFLNSTNVTVTNNTAVLDVRGFAFDGNTTVRFTNNINLTGNTIRDVFTGIEMGTFGPSHNNIIADNNVNNSSFLIVGSGSNYTVMGNTFEGALIGIPSGFLFTSSSGIVVTGNNFTGTSLNVAGRFDTVTDSVFSSNFGNGGIQVGSSDNVTVMNNIGSAFSILFTTNYSVVNNTASSPFGCGFSFNSPSSSISGNTAINCTGRPGFSFTFDSVGSSLSNSSSSGNFFGIEINSNVTLSGVHLYNNSEDIRLVTFSPPLSFSASDLIIDNPSGNFQNYTNLSIADVLNGSSEGYTIDWSAQPATPLPPGKSSFAGKFVNITKLLVSPAVSIDSITWHWVDSEPGAFAEANFELWKLNASGWTLVNGTPDTAANTLSLTNHSIASVYAILAPIPPNCPVINTSGLYQMNNSFVGAPNSATPLTGTACVLINSSNVLFDCNGFNITNNGTGGTTRGILLNGSLTNVTVKNCAAISGYTYGVESNRTNDSLFMNNTIFNVSNGIRMTNSSNNTITGSRINTTGVSSNHGVFIQGGSNNSISNNSVSTTGSSIDNNGIYLNASSANNISGNNVSVNGSRGNYGIFLRTSSNNNSVLYNQVNARGVNDSNRGIALLTSVSGTLVIGNNVTTNGTSGNHGISIEASSSGNRIENNSVMTNGTAAGGGNAGIYGITNTSNTNISGNNVSTDGFGTSNDGIRFDLTSNNNIITNNNVSTRGANGRGIVLNMNVNNTIVANNTIRTNGSSSDNFGIVLNANVSNTNVTNNTVSTNGTSSNSGIVGFTNITNTIISGNTISTNGTGASNTGILVSISVNNTIVSDNNVTTGGGSGVNNIGVSFNTNVSNATISGNNITTGGLSSTNIGIRLDTNTNNSIIINNSITTGGVSTNHGIFLNVNVTNTTIINNTIRANGSSTTNFGIVVGSGGSASNNLIHQNDIMAPSPGSTCIQVQTSSVFNNVTNNNISNCTGHGVLFIGNASNGIIANNRAENTGGNGFETRAGSNNVTIANNTAINATLAGFRVQTSRLNTLTNNNATMSLIGLHILNSNDTSVTGIMSSGNTQSGLQIDNSTNSTVNSAHLYNNSPDVQLNGSGMTVNLTNIILDNPLGTFENYTNLSINDTVSSAYSIDHSTEPLTAPPGDSFAQKYVNITLLEGPTSIDRITWHWLESELTINDNESDFELWKFDGANWLLQNDTSDNMSNTLSLSGLSSLSIFGILQNVSANFTGANISINKTDVSVLPVSPGGTTVFDINITNNGTSPATPTVVDELPAGLTFISASQTPDSVVGQVITWNSVFVSGLSTTTLTIQATVDQGIVSDSTRTVNLTNFVNATFNSTTVNSTVNTTVTYANVSITKEDITPFQASSGGTLEWRINVTNTGNTSLNVTVNDTIPPGLAFSSSSPPGSVSGQNVSWNFSLAPGASSIIFLNTTAITSGVFNNPVNATAIPPNGANVTASASALTTVLVASINVSKTANNSTPAIGDNVSYAINITNNGSANLTVTAIDILPAGVTFLGSDVPPSNTSGGIIRWDAFALLQPGESAIIVYNVSVDSGGTKINDLSVIGDPPNGNNATSNTSVSFTAPFPPSGGNNNQQEPELDIETTSTTSGTRITVTSDGDTIAGAHVIVMNADTLATIFVGDTDGFGEVVSTPCYPNIKVRASKSGYLSKTIVTQVACLLAQVSECTDDDQCPLNSRCINPQIPGRRFGPLSTYDLLPAFAICADDLIATNADEDEIITICGKHIPDNVTPFLLSVSGGLPFCSDRCTYVSNAVSIFDPHTSDCRGPNTCIHPDVDFEEIGIAHGRCRVPPTNSCTHDDNCTSSSQKFCVSGACKEIRCDEDIDCHRGSYCEDIYGICVPGCKELHELNCELGSFCSTDTSPVTVDTCDSGCKLNENCQWYQKCADSGCVDLGCGKIVNHTLIGTSYDCSVGGLLLPGQEPNPKCVCDSGQFCNTSAYVGSAPKFGFCNSYCGLVENNVLVESWQCDQSNPSCTPCGTNQVCSAISHTCINVISCDSDQNCQPPPNSVCETEPPENGTKQCVLYEMVGPNGSIGANEIVSYKVFRNGQPCEGCTCSFVIGGNTVNVTSVNGLCNITTGSSGGSVEAKLYSKENTVLVQTVYNDLFTPEEEAYARFWESINNLCLGGTAVIVLLILSSSLFLKRTSGVPPKGKQ